MTLQKCLKMQLKIYGEEAVHQDIAFSLNGLGSVYCDQRKLEKAEQTHQKCLEMRLQIYGTEAVHPDIAHSLNNLGSVYGGQGKYEDAEELFGRALNMATAIHGTGAAHRDIAIMLKNLTGVLRNRANSWKRTRCRGNMTICEMQIRLKNVRQIKLLGLYCLTSAKCFNI